MTTINLRTLRRSTENTFIFNSFKETTSPILREKCRFFVFKWWEFGQLLELGKRWSTFNQCTLASWKTPFDVRIWANVGYLFIPEAAPLSIIHHWIIWNNLYSSFMCNFYGWLASDKFYDAENVNIHTVYASRFKSHCSGSNESILFNTWHSCR